MNTKSDSDTHDLENALHRARCTACSTLWDELNDISAEASRLPLLTPARDLWDGIEARITTLPRSLPFYRSQTFRLAIAASLLVAVSSGVTWRLATTNTPAAPVVATAAQDAAQTHLASFAETVTQMDREIAALETLVTERRGQLDPRTVAVLEANLKLIDTAIDESRAALESDPASGYLSAQFTRAYTSKLTLLREAATLPVGI